MVGDPGEAEGVLQLTFIKACEKMSCLPMSKLGSCAGCTCPCPSCFLSAHGR